MSAHPRRILLVAAFLAATTGLSASAATGPASGPDMRSTNFALDWRASGEISGGGSSSSNFRLTATIGQMAAATHSGSANFSSCSGFQCIRDDIRATLRVFLPALGR